MSPSSVLIAGDPQQLAIKFIAHKIDDRFQSTLSIIKFGEEHPLMSSVEGDGQQPWPPSPPFQECLEQRIGEDTIVLATGMAGKTHWSMSVEADDSPALVCDVACRTGTPPTEVGSQFVIQLEEVETDKDALLIRGQAFTARVVTLPVDEISATIATQTDPTGVVIRPTFEDSALPCTIRWKYRLTAQ